MCALALAAGGSAAPASAQAGDGASFDHAALVTRVVDGHIVPGFASLEMHASSLAPAVTAVCAGDAGARLRLVSAFRDTVAALAAVDFYRFGPLAGKGRREKLAFWPDPRGVVARQMRALIAAGDAPPDAAWIATQSAAVQGLPALEFLMTETAAPLGPAQVRRCAIASAIAGNIAALAGETHAAWVAPDGYAARMRSAGAINPIYKSHAEAAAEILKALMTGLQVVADLHVKPRLPKAKPGVKGPYHRLGLESTVYTAATGSLAKLYALLHLEAALAPDKAWMKNWARGAWRAMAMSDGMGGPADGVKAADTPPLREVASRISGLRQLIGREMANASGIAIGFNELDGD